MTLGNLKKQAKDMLNQYKEKDTATYAAAQQAIGGLLVLDGLTGIDNPFAGKKRPGIFGSLGGILLGVVFMVMPTAIGKIAGTSAMTATTTATVVSVGIPDQTNSSGSSSSSGGSTCSMVASYTVGSKEYRSQSTVSSSSNCGLSAGDQITINYNPDKPASWAYDMKTMDLFLKIFFFVGLFVVVASLVTFLIRLLSIIFGWKLLRSGRALAATLPQGTNLQTIVDQIKTDFVGKIFNFGGGQQPLAAAVGVLQAAAPATPVPAPTPAAQPPIQTGELEKLAELKAKGIISEADFEAKKKQILGL